MATKKTTKAKKTEEPIEEIQTEEIQEEEIQPEAAAAEAEPEAAADEPVEVEANDPVEVEVEIEEEKIEQGSGWRTGYPAKEGWYLCKADGKEVRLYHYMSLSCKIHKWVTEDGHQATAKEIVWAEPLKTSPL